MLAVWSRQHHRHRLAVRRMAEDQARCGERSGMRLAVNDVDRALRVGMLVVERGRNQPVLKRQNAHGRLQRAAAGAEIPEIALRRRYRHVAQRGADRLGLDAVVVDRCSCRGRRRIRCRRASGRRRARRPKGRGEWPPSPPSIGSPPEACRKTNPSDRRPRRSRGCGRGSGRRGLGHAVRVSKRNAAAPSPLTVPSRSASKGRDAAAGSSPRRESSLTMLRAQTTGCSLRADRRRRSSRRPVRARESRTASAIAERARDIAHRDRVVRAAGVLGDADVAGRHVGQVLQHPEREQLGHRRRAPAAKVELARRRCSCDTCRSTRPARRESWRRRR